MCPLSAEIFIILQEKLIPVRLVGNIFILRYSYCIASIINENIPIYFLEIFVRFPCCIALQPMSPIPMKAVELCPFPVVEKIQEKRVWKLLLSVAI